jgi:hypothetical protein
MRFATQDLQHSFVEHDCLTYSCKYMATVLYMVCIEKGMSC